MYMDTENNNEEIIIESVETTEVIEKTMSVGDWVITLILLSIPVVNIIMFIVWLTSSKTPQTKKNYLYASLVIIAIAFVVSLLFGSIFASLLGGLQ